MSERYDGKERLALTQEQLLKEVVYNPETGIMMHKETLSIGNKTAQSSRRKGVLQIKVNGYWYLVHRLAWLYIYGKWPDNLIDHINGDTFDNRLCNLRDVTHKQNGKNRYPYSKEV